MPDDKKTKDKSSPEESAPPSVEGTPAEATTEAGAATNAAVSPPTEQVTLSRAQQEALRRRLKEKYH